VTASFTIYGDSTASTEELKQVLMINVVGTFIVSKLAALLMAQNKK